MQAEVTFLTRRGEATMRRSVALTAERLRFGRGTENEVPLPDIRVPLTAAVLSPRADGLLFEQTGDLSLRRGGQSTASTTVGPGDEIGLGPYLITLREPPTGFDVALSVELVQPLGNALQQVLGRSRIGLEQTRLSRRGVSWVLFLVLLVLGLAAPIAAYFAGRPATAPTSVQTAGGAAAMARAAWNPGALSNAHRYFADQCGTCHRAPFKEVADAACLTCHRGVGNHLPGTAAPAVHADLAGRRCADCHVEHRGLRSLVIREAALCVDCHATLAQRAPASGIRDVAGWSEDGHPQFRATVVADPTIPSFAKVEIGTAPLAADHPGLVFSHREHLRPEGFPVLGYKPLVCAQCHVPEPSGQGFQPITYKAQCRSCHRLRFDVELPWQEVPHGDDTAVATTVEGFYAAQALRDGAPPAAPSQIERRLPGGPSGAAPATQAGWIAQKTQAALAIIFRSKQGCFYCHIADPKRGPYAVTPVRMQTRFLPPARFDHASHRALACEDCHAAARQAQSSAELLIPGKARCLTCHGAEDAAFKAESPCISCHVFHRQELGPMRRSPPQG